MSYTAVSGTCTKRQRLTSFGLGRVGKAIYMYTDRFVCHAVSKADYACIYYMYMYMYVRVYT